MRLENKDGDEDERGLVNQLKRLSEREGGVKRSEGEMQEGMEERE